MLTDTVAFLRFVILGAPVPKGRPRARVTTPKGGGKPFAHLYTDADTRAWEEEVERQVRGQLQVWQDSPTPGTLYLPLAGRTVCSMRFNVPRPVSAPKSVLYPLKKPDLDNLEKSALDAIVNAGILKDDNVVSDLNTRKRFANDEHPLGIEIELTSWLT